MADNLMYVRGAGEAQPDGGRKVRLSEDHADHPNGTAFVVAGEVAQVARTPAVLAGLQSGRLLEASDAAAGEKAAAERNAAALAEPVTVAVPQLAVGLTSAERAEADASLAEANAPEPAKAAPKGGK